MRKVIIIISSVLLLLVAGACGYGIWLAHHYKGIIMARLPEAVLSSTDSIYHISFTDIDVSLAGRSVVITNVRLWPDMEQVTALKAAGRHVPPTLSTLSIPRLEVDGIAWRHLIDSHSLDCGHVTVHDLKWLLACRPNTDTNVTHDKQKTPKIDRVTATHIDFDNPDITYDYAGSKTHFTCHMNGGKAMLDNFVYNYDSHKDTSVFLYARSGKLRFEKFQLNKPNGHYHINAPLLDFESSAEAVILKAVHINNMTDDDPVTGKEKEFYNFTFPKIEMVGLNWNRLVNDGELVIPTINAAGPLIDVHYIRANENKNSSAMGSYPNQLLLQVGLQTDLRVINMTNAHFKYSEKTTKGDEGTIGFNAIKAKFSNITNIQELISRDNHCLISLDGKYMNKTPVTADFVLALDNKKGAFTMDGTIGELTGDEVTEQAQAFTIVKVTSFHLSKMDMHISGDETYSSGKFTVFYDGLKISLFKFDSKMREGKQGPFAFVGSTLLLYPDNPMPGKEVRSVTTSFARDTTKGFAGELWQNIYRGIKKTAVRERGIITLTDGPETKKGEVPKKGFFKRVFGKKK
jgi:hypothetical protein